MLEVDGTLASVLSATMKDTTLSAVSCSLFGFLSLSTVLVPIDLAWDVFKYHDKGMVLLGSFTQLEDEALPHPVLVCLLFISLLGHGVSKVVTDDVKFIELSFICLYLLMI